MTSLFQLRTVCKFRLNKLQDEIIEHTYQWNKQHKCSCIPKSFEPTKDNMIICEHLKKDREKKFQERIDKLFSQSIALGQLALVKVKSEIADETSH